MSTWETDCVGDDSVMPVHAWISGNWFGTGVRGNSIGSVFLWIGNSGIWFGAGIGSDSIESMYAWVGRISDSLFGTNGENGPDSIRSASSQRGVSVTSTWATLSPLLFPIWLELGLDLFFFWWFSSKAGCCLIVVFNNSFSSKTLALNEVFPHPLRWFLFMLYVTCSPQPQVQGMHMGIWKKSDWHDLTFKLHSTSSEIFLHRYCWMIILISRIQEWHFQQYDMGSCNNRLYRYCSELRI